MFRIRKGRYFQVRPLGSCLKPSSALSSVSSSSSGQPCSCLKPSSYVDSQSLASARESEISSVSVHRERLDPQVENSLTSYDPRAAVSSSDSRVNLIRRTLARPRSEGPLARLSLPVRSERLSVLVSRERLDPQVENSLTSYYPHAAVSSSVSGNNLTRRTLTRPRSEGPLTRLSLWRLLPPGKSVRQSKVKRQGASKTGATRFSRQQKKAQRQVKRQGKPAINARGLAPQWTQAIELVFMRNFGQLWSLGPMVATMRPLARARKRQSGLSP